MAETLVNRFDRSYYDTRCLTANVCKWLAFPKYILFIYLFICLLGGKQLNVTIISWRSANQCVEVTVKHCHLNSFQNGFNFLR